MSQSTLSFAGGRLLLHGPGRGSGPPIPQLDPARAGGDQTVLVASSQGQPIDLQWPSHESIDPSSGESQGEEKMLTSPKGSFTDHMVEGLDGGEYEDTEGDARGASPAQEGHEEGGGAIDEGAEEHPHGVSTWNPMSTATAASAVNRPSAEESLALSGKANESVPKGAKDNVPTSGSGDKDVKLADSGANVSQPGDKKKQEEEKKRERSEKRAAEMASLNETGVVAYITPALTALNTKAAVATINERLKCKPGEEGGAMHTIYSKGQTVIYFPVSSAGLRKQLENGVVINAVGDIFTISSAAGPQHPGRGAKEARIIIRGGNKSLEMAAVRIALEENRKRFVQRGGVLAESDRDPRNVVRAGVGIFLINNCSAAYHAHLAETKVLFVSHFALQISADAGRPPRREGTRKYQAKPEASPPSRGTSSGRVRSGFSYAAAAGGGGSMASVSPAPQTSDVADTLSALSARVAELERKVVTQDNNDQFLMMEVLTLRDRMDKQEAATESLAADMEAKHGEVIGMLAQIGARLGIAAKPKVASHSEQASHPRGGTSDTLSASTMSSSQLDTGHSGTGAAAKAAASPKRTPPTPQNVKSAQTAKKTAPSAPLKVNSVAQNNVPKRSMEIEAAGSVAKQPAHTLGEPLKGPLYMAFVELRTGPNGAFHVAKKIDWQSPFSALVYRDESNFAKIRVIPPRLWSGLFTCQPIQVGRGKMNAYPLEEIAYPAESDVLMLNGAPLVEQGGVAFFLFDLVENEQAALVCENPQEALHLQRLLSTQSAPHKA